MMTLKIKPFNTKIPLSLIALLVPLWLSGLVPFFVGCAQAEKGKTIVLYHTSDIHGYIAKREAKYFKKDPTRQVGGFAALKNLLVREKRPYILLDSGDMFAAGAPEGSITRGESLVTLMNHLGYSAAAIGNHEFDFGERTLYRFADKAEFPLLAANIKFRHPIKVKEEDKEDGEKDADKKQDEEKGEGEEGEEKEIKKIIKTVPDYVTAYTIKEIDNIKIGIFGLITQQTAYITAPKNVRRLKFLSPTIHAKNMVKKLREEEGCSLVIALTHIGWQDEDDKPFDDDKHIAKKVPGIDVILGGHSHTFLKTAFQDPDTKTIIIHSGEYLSAVGRLELVLAQPKQVQGRTVQKVSGFTHELKDLWIDEVGEDAKTLSIVEKYKKQVDKKLSKVIGRALDDFLPNELEESTLGNLITDSFRDWAKADIAFHNSGGIRNKILKGEITLRHNFSVSPFPNTLVTMKLTGSQILEILEKTVSTPHGIMQVSGLKYTYDPKRPKERRVTRVIAGNQPIARTKSYLVATNSFLAQGGDGYKTFKFGVNIKNSGVSTRSIVAKYITKKSPISPKKENRISTK
ncbi:bifunctional metallophosphatase/5'-nucleotidase [Elusimicrobiota bacterium]